MAESFEWEASPDARALVLGTVPGRESLRLRQYYANRRNVFWRIMGDLFGIDINLSYRDRIEALKRSGVALWDVLASATRENSSLDSAIQPHSVVPNDIAAFLSEHPQVTHIFLNGAKADELFSRHVASALLPGRVVVSRLPSTSPANASMCYLDKLSAWKALAQASDSCWLDDRRARLVWTDSRQVNFMSPRRASD